VLSVLATIWKRCTGTPASRNPDGQPNLPGPSPYRCRHCLTTILLYQVVQRENPNRNVGRPYYVCVNSGCSNVTGPNNVGQHYRGWVTWDDSIGVEWGNPPCKCGRSARRDTAGERSVHRGRQFWTCSTGACDLFSWL